LQRSTSSERITMTRSASSVLAARIATTPPIYGVRQAHVTHPAKAA
jgi:hypothetical protein